MARIVAEAAVRLRADGRDLGKSMAQELRKAANDTNTGQLFEKAEKEADAAGKRMANSLRKAFAGLGSLVGGLGRVAAGAVSAGLQVSAFAVKLALVGSAITLLLAGLTSLTTGFLGLGAAIGNATGIVALLPAALLGVGAVMATVKIATSGLGDAFAAIAEGDAAAFADSLEKLTPAAKAFAKAAKDAFGNLREVLQENLFANLASVMKTLSTTALPPVKQLFIDIAKEINGTAFELGNFLSGAVQVQKISGITGNLSLAFGNLTNAIKPAVASFLDIALVGSGFLPRLSQELVVVTERFQRFIAAAASDGRLEAFIQRAIDTIKALGTIIANVFGGLGGIFKASEAAGLGFLETMTKATARFKEFTTSPGGQEQLVKFFTSMRELTSALLPVLGALASLFATTLVPIFANLAGSIGPPLVGFIQTFGEALRAAAPAIAALGQGIASVITAAGPLIAALVPLIANVAATIVPALAPIATGLAGAFAAATPGLIALAQGIATLFTAIAPVLPVIGQLAGILAGALGKALQVLAPVLARVVQAFADGLLMIMPQLEPILVQVATAIGDLIMAAMPLIPVFFQIISALLPLLPPLVQLVAAVLPPIISLVQALTPIIVQLAGVFVDLLPPIIALVTTILDILIPPIKLIAVIVGQSLAIVAEIFATTFQVVAGILSVIGNIISSVFGGIFNTISSIVNAIGSFISAGFNRIRDFFSTILGAIVGVVSGGINNIKNFFSNLPGQILDFLKSLPGRLSDFAGDLIRGMIRGLGNLAGAIGDKLLSIVKGAWDGVLSFFGIKSPSTRAATAMENVGKGMIKGFEGISGRVDAAALNLASGVMESLASPFSEPVGLNLGGGGAVRQAIASGQSVVIQQTNVMQPGADVKAFAAEVNRRAANDVSAVGSLASTSVGPVQADNFGPSFVFGVR